MIWRINYCILANKNILSSTKFAHKELGKWLLEPLEMSQGKKLWYVRNTIIRSKEFRQVDGRGLKKPLLTDPSVPEVFPW